MKLLALFKKHASILLLIFAIFTILSGFWVYYCVYNTLNVFQAIFYSFALFALDVKQPVEIGLDNTKIDDWKYIYIPAFTGLVTTLASLLGFALKLFDDFIQKIYSNKITKNREHIIVCGLGQNNRYLVNNLLENNKIVIIDNDVNNLYIASYNRKKNVTVIIGNANNEEVLRDAGVLTCKQIIISAGTDIVNLTIAAQVKELYDLNSNSDFPDLYIHVANHASEIYYDETKLFKNHASKIQYFSYNEIAARMLFENLELDTDVDTVTSDENVHLMIVGFGSLGQEVALQAIIRGHFYNAKKTCITVIDISVDAYNSFMALYPEAEEVCNFEFKQCSVNSLDFYKYFFNVCKNKTIPSYIVFALADDKNTFSAVTTLNHRLIQEGYSEKGLSFAVRFRHHVNNKILEAISSNDNVRLFQFGKTSEISSEKHIINSQLDKQAKEIHNNYKKDYPGMGSWEMLSNFYKDSNRATADHIKIKINTLNKLEKNFILERDLEHEFKRVFLGNKVKDKHSCVYKLIDMEHRRWNAFHIISGWKKMSEAVYLDKSSKACTKLSHKDNNNKSHACLVETSDLGQVGIRYYNDFSHFYNEDKKVIEMAEKLYKLDNKNAK